MISQKPVESAAEQVLREIEDLAKKEFLPIIGPRKGKFLVKEICKVKALHVLEVGTLIGYSAILMGKGLTSNAEIVTIEIHQNEAEQAGVNILKANIPPKIKIIAGNAIEVIPTLQGSFDFAFIDAEKKEYLQYLQLAESKLNCGAVVFADSAGIFADQ